jgi:hypothetical protein
MVSIQETFEAGRARLIDTLEPRQLTANELRVKGTSATNEPEETSVSAAS